MIGCQKMKKKTAEKELIHREYSMEIKLLKGGHKFILLRLQPNQKGP